MLSIANKSIMLNFITQSVIMLNVIMLFVIMSNVMAPFEVEQLTGISVIRMEHRFTRKY